MGEGLRRRKEGTLKDDHVCATGTGVLGTSSPGTELSEVVTLWLLGAIG